MFKRIKANPFLSIFAGFVFGWTTITLAQTVDNLNRVWNGVHTFSAPVTFSDAVTGLSLQTISTAAGTAEAPSITFTDDGDTGVYRVSADRIGLTTNGIVRLLVDSTTIQSTSVYTGPTASAVAPTFAFSADQDTGVYLAAPGNIGLSAGGALQLTVGEDTSTFAGGIIHQSFRDEFDYHCFVSEQADDTDELVVDNGENHSACRHSIDSKLLYQFKLDGAQASPFIITGGQLDIDQDAGAGEGVNMVFARDPQTTGGYQFGTAYYFRVSLEVGDVSDASVFHFGWRLNQDHIDDQVLITQTDYASFSIPAGTASATASTNGSEQTELESSCDMADGETWVFEIRVSAIGVPTFYCVENTEASLALLTTPTAVGPFESPDVMVPYIAYVGTAGTTEIKLNFIEVGLN